MEERAGHPEGAPREHEVHEDLLPAVLSRALDSLGDVVESPRIGKRTRHRAFKLAKTLQEDLNRLMGW